MLSRNALGQFLRAPASSNTSCSSGSIIQDVSFVTIIHNLLVIHNLLHIRPIIIDSHVAHQEDLSILDETRERTKHLHAVRNVSDPISILTFHRPRNVVWSIFDKFKAIFAFEYRFHSVIGFGCYHHPIFGRFRQLFAPGWRATGHDGPRAIITNHGCVVRREFIIFFAKNKQSLAMLDHSHVVDVIPIVTGHRDVTVFYLRHDARCKTLRQWITPLSVDLTNRRGISLELHVVVAAENYAGTQTGTCWSQRIKRSVRIYAGFVIFENMKQEF